MSAVIAKHLSKKEKSEIAVFLANQGWKKVGVALQHWRDFDESLFACDLDSVMRSTDLPLADRRTVGEAWCMSKIACDSPVSIMLRAAIDEGKSRYIRALTGILMSFGDVIAARKEERITRRSRDRLSDEVIATALKLSQLLRNTLFDQSAFFYCSEAELSGTANVLIEELRSARLPPLGTEQMMYGAVAKALAGDRWVPTDREKIDSALNLEGVDMETLRAVWSLEKSTPRVSELLDRLANRFGVGPSDFGANPGSLRALRKAFATRMKMSGEVGGPTTAFIALVVEALFDEQVDPADLFG
ncbi:MAG: hypothetical protein ABIR16_01535 [Dokdonella sp.]